MSDKRAGAGAEVLVTTDRATYRVGLRGPIPMPVTSEDADSVNEVLLRVGHRVAGEKGETLTKVEAPSIEAFVYWWPDTPEGRAAQEAMAAEMARKCGRIELGPFIEY
jgi:hypothetical protein